jgi:hypothetical protein
MQILLGSRLHHNGWYEPSHRSGITRAMVDRRDSIYAELGVPPEEPEDPLDRWRRMRPEPESKPRERRLDRVPPTLDDIDRRIGERFAAEHKFMMDILAELLAHIQSDAEMRGPPGPAGSRGEQGPPGKLPLVKLWTPDTVHYEGDVVAYDGGTFQAKRDTGQPPRHTDWICLATSGRDAKGITVRGTFDETAEYRRLDVVALNGGSFVALKDAPGPCPGSGWQLLASQGKRGVAGEKGERGPPGPRGDAGASGATIRDWKIDRARYVATPLMSDGSEGPPLELRGLFEQFFLEAR